MISVYLLLDFYKEMRLKDEVYILSLEELIVENGLRFFLY